MHAHTPKHKHAPARGHALQHACLPMRACPHTLRMRPSCKQQAAGTTDARPKPTDQAPPGAVTKRPEVMDDFLRNFFVKMGLTRTCEAFEAEWYELKATGKLEGAGAVPDVYARNAVRSTLACQHVCMR